MSDDPDQTTNVVALGHRRTNQANHQTALIAYIRSCGATGVTWKELAQSLDLHHGQASGALSGLHRRGIIARLTNGRRERCRIYVHPDFVSGRPVDPERPVRLVDQLFEFLKDMPPEALDAAGRDWREQRRKMLELYADRRG